MTNIEIVRKINDGFVEGDIKKIMRHMAADVRLEVIGASTSLNKKIFRKEVCEAHIIGLPVLKIKNEIEDGDWIAVEGEMQCRKTDGKMLNAIFFEVYRLKDGKIMEVRSFVIERNKPAYLSINNY